MEVHTAEKEASEVLHSLLSVERVEKSSTVKPENIRFTATDDHGEVVGQIHWETQADAHEIFSGQYQQDIDDGQVIWEGDIEEATVDDTQKITTVYQQPHREIGTTDDDEELDITEVKKVKKAKLRPPLKVKTKTPLTKNKKLAGSNENHGHSERNEPTKLETSAHEVKQRFKRGCECQDESCFRGLNPENVYKHRLNIAELTKGEHDMYLMGVTMACLANPDTTVRQKERRRLRTQYVYQGRRVCLDAFLYLENCTHYQLKRIRKHVMTHGVAPRVHGNHGKKPHNTFSLDIYRHATEFLKQYMRQQTGDSGITNSKQPVQLPCDISRKNLHDAYKEYGHILEPGTKLMGYSTFRHFMKVQFPHLKFSKLEPKSVGHNPPAPVQPAPQQAVQPVPQVEPVKPIVTSAPTLKVEQPQNIQIQKCVISNELQQVIPLVVASSDGSTAQQPQTFIVTPVPQIISNGTGHTTANTFSYQLTNGYVINEQGNIVSTVTNAQTPQFTFNRI